MTPEYILNYIKYGERSGTISKFTFIITGRVGPTGKTWLSSQLKQNGYRAVELAEYRGLEIRHSDDSNHYVIDMENEVMVITLNNILDEYQSWPKTSSRSMHELTKEFFDYRKEDVTFTYRPLIPEIEDVIFNDPATIILWSDKTKTVVKTQPGDFYDPEKGFAMAVAKKAFGNKGNYYNEFDKWLKEYDGLWPTR